MTAGRPADPVAAAVGRSDFPMYVVTADDGQEMSGCLVGFVTQCSIEPLRLLVCLSTPNHTARVARRTDTLGVHLLGADQHPVAELFGELTGDTVDKLALVPWHRGCGGAPILDDCAAWWEGRVLDRFDLGDHTGYLCTPLDGGPGGCPGQLLYSAVRDIVAGHPPDD